MVNGEQKFPEVLIALENAEHHIHIQYYIYENDEIGKSIESLLIKKASEGLEVLNAIAYDSEFAMEMRTNFFRDLEDSEEIDALEWNQRAFYKQLAEKTARLVSPLL